MVGKQKGSIFVAEIKQMFNPINKTTMETTKKNNSVYVVTVSFNDGENNDHYTSIIGVYTNKEDAKKVAASRVAIQNEIWDGKIEKVAKTVVCVSHKEKRIMKTYRIIEQPLR